MRSARIELALKSGLMPLPDAGKVLVLRPQTGDDLSVLPRDRVVVETGFRPDHEHFARAGFALSGEGPFAAAVVCVPRARAAALALIARAMEQVVPGGPVLIDGQKTDGIEAILRACREAGLPLGEVLSKAHGKVAALGAAPAPQGWAAVRQMVEGGFQTDPFCFSADGPDAGSALLATALPARLGPKVADLGAGWGYLSRAILSREGVKRLDLVEAEASALACARSNIDDPRARFHWADARTFRPENLVETVVMNPPFHTGREADPALGMAFLRAAHGMMAPDGALWLVANRHLPYDRTLTALFRTVEDIGGTPAFRLIRAAQPIRAR